MLAEMFVGGEGLQRGAGALLATLLHEAAHGVASTRGVQDVSRGGRYHNGRFAGLARELGLDVARAGGVGHHGPGRHRRGLQRRAGRARRGADRVAAL